MTMEIIRPEKRTSTSITFKFSYTFVAMRFIKTPFLLTLCAFYNVSNAQDYIDLAQLQYDYSNPSQFDSSDKKTAISSFSFSFTVPIVISKKTTFITGGAIDKFWLKLAPSSSNTTLSSYLFKAGFNIKHSTKVSGTYLLLPKLASDFEKNIHSQDFQFGALGLLKFEKRDHLKYKLGLYYNPDRFGTFFVPLLGLYYNTEKLEVDITLPVSANARYKLNKSWSLGGDFRAVVKSFNLHRAYFSTGNQYVHQSINTLSAYLACEFKSGIILKGQVGYTIGRSYRIYDNSDKIDFGISAFKFGDHRNQLNTDFSDGLVVRAELVYRFYLEDE